MSPNTLGTGSIEATDCFLGFIQKQMDAGGGSGKVGVCTNEHERRTSECLLYQASFTPLTSDSTREEILCTFSKLEKKQWHAQSEPNMSLRAALCILGINSLSRLSGQSVFGKLFQKTIVMYSSPWALIKCHEMQIWRARQGERDNSSSRTCCKRGVSTYECIWVWNIHPRFQT